MSEKGIAELLSDYKGKEKEIVERSYRIACKDNQ